MKFPHCGENWNPRCCCGWLENKQSSAAIANARLWNLQHWAKIPVFLLPLGPKIFPPVKRQTQATKTPKQFSEAQGCFGWTRVVRCGIFCCCRSDQSDRHLCSFRVSLLVVLPLTRLLVGLLWLEQQPQNELWRPHCLPLHCPQNLWITSLHGKTPCCGHECQDIASGVWKTLCGHQLA